MLILVDIRKASNPASGLGQFCINLAGALLHQNPGCSFHFLVDAPQHAGSLLIRSNDKIITRSGLVKRYDLIHLTHQESEVPAYVKGPRAMTIHDLNFYYRYTSLKRFTKKIMLQSRMRPCIRFSVVSQFTSGEIQRVLGVSADDITVIYNGVNCSEEAVRPPIPLPDSFLLYLGNIHERKNLRVLFSMMQYVQKDLVLVGSGPELHRMRFIKQARAHGIENKLLFTGARTEAEKNFLLKQCDALVNPSLQEGFGLPLMEAFHFGKPVFCFRASALAELGAGFAFFWEKQDPLVMAETIRARMLAESSSLQAARIRYASEFNWERAAKEYLAWYHLSA